VRRSPTLLVPYEGPDGGGNHQDIYLYLRPESNGIKVESTLLGVIYNNPYLKEHVQLVYLANMPGDYILDHHIIEHHYSLNLLFAAMGRDAFTEAMKEDFKNFFGVSCDEVPVMGAFEALLTLDMTEEELFKIRVPEKDLLSCHGQTIKKVQDYYIVNYDMPAILHKNNLQTDILVMALRVSLDWDSFRKMVKQMTEALIKAEVLNPHSSASRVFHYSKSPFEEIIDGQEYLYSPDDRFTDEDISFFSYMKSKGVEPRELRDVVNSRIIYTRNSRDPGVREKNILVATRGFSYSQALEFYQNIESIYTVTGERHLGEVDELDSLF